MRNWMRWKTIDPHCIHLKPRYYGTMNFVPVHTPPKVTEMEALCDFISLSSNLLVVTGAGISTESGIPDYRSEGVGLYARSSTRPVQYQNFIKSSSIRKRYWARNFVGWPRFSSFQPNPAHRVLSDWEAKGRLQCLVTQNVDRLHQKAGSRNVVELHGSTHDVVCLNCEFLVQRHEFQDILSQMNPLMKLGATMIRPDGDVDLSQEQVEGFTVPDCEQCGGILKPNIVFFGDNVPRERVEKVRKEIEKCDALLIVGSSMFVFSGFRIILQAAELGKPIAIVNIGETRGDKFAQVKVSARCSDVLTKINV